jgi:hypothetical protein
MRGRLTFCDPLTVQFHQHMHRPLTFLLVAFLFCTSCQVEPPEALSEAPSKWKSVSHGASEEASIWVIDYYRTKNDTEIEYLCVDGATVVVASRSSLTGVGPAHGVGIVKISAPCR